MSLNRLCQIQAETKTMRLSAMTAGTNHAQRIIARALAISPVFVAAALLLTLAACSLLTHTEESVPQKNAPRAQLSIGYSMLYQEAEERKAIGADMAKDFTPLIGKSGVEFEREALLMFYNALNEQGHLVGVMLQRETDPGLRKFLETTKAQLDACYTKVGALLNRRYFTH